NEIVLAREIRTGQRHLIQQRHGRGIKMKRWIIGNVVSRNRLPGQRIDDRARTREISGAFRHGRYAEKLRQISPGSLPVVINKKECAGFGYGPAQSTAKLILSKRRRRAGQSEKVLGVEDVIAHEFVKAAVQVIGA